MVTSNPTARAGITLLAFPPAKEVQIIKVIAGATGLNATKAKELAENLPATIRALLSDLALADDLKALGATVERPAPEAQSLTPRELDLITRFREILKEAQEHVLAVARGDVKPETQPPDGRVPADRNERLTDVLTLLRSAVSMFAGGDRVPDADVLGELARMAEANLSAYADDLAGPEGSEVYDALDCCAVVRALTEAGLDPHTEHTISPIHGVVGLAVARLEGIGAEESDTH